MRIPPRAAAQGQQQGFKFELSARIAGYIARYLADDPNFDALITALDRDFSGLTFQEFVGGFALYRAMDGAEAYRVHFFESGGEP